MNNFIETPVIRSPIARKKLVYGVGINDSNYAVKQTTNGKSKVCPFYKRWTGMLDRCYSVEYQKKHPTYKDCYVCDEWLSFESFRSWMAQQDWQGMHLDKDIIKYNNKMYSPENCCFISRELNLLLTNCKKSKKELPLGVQKNSREIGFRVQMSYRGNPIYLGLFNTVKEASNAYINKKAEIILTAADKHPDRRIKSGLRLHAQMLSCGLKR